MHPKDISIQEYTYTLPDDKIALHPLDQRDAAQLLVYKSGEITVSNYSKLADHLPPNSFLVFNNTRVINARILFTKPTGGVIELFLLEPYGADYTTTLTSTASCTWKCLIGGASKWKSGPLEKIIRQQETLQASLIEKLPDAYVVNLQWTGACSFAEVLEDSGNIPLPPYIKRSADETDKERYQTVYAQHNGSVAAPTAGLHFTPALFNSLQQQNIHTGFVTLHVGAGTFKPVKAATMMDHEMHAEWIDVDIAFIEQLLLQQEHTVVAVGTTSLRTLESIYWMGIKAMVQPELSVITIGQWEVYDLLQHHAVSAQASLSALINWMKKNNCNRLFTQTQILIAPGYQFRIAKAIVTNFHQPQSTLLLLVAAAVASDWKKIYQFALDNNFRFLSYGDGSLLFISS